MTTILAAKVREPYPAVVFATDLQGSYDDPVETRGAIILQGRKAIARKIEQTPDDALLFAATGANNAIYREFADAVRGRPTSLDHFNFVDELRSGYSKTIADLNYKAMTAGNNHLPARHINLEQSFQLGVVYRTEEDVELWWVTETGLVLPTNGLPLGSGGRDASGAFKVLTQASDIPSKYKTELSKVAYAIRRSVYFATLHDAHSIGVDAVVVSTRGIENISEQIRDETMAAEQKAERRVLNALDNPK
jgi:hypothetical protein